MEPPGRFVLAYRAANALEAHLVKHLLESNDIPTEVSGEYLAGGVGELPVEVLQVEVRTKPEYVAAARQLIRQHQEQGPSEEPPWICPFCGEENDPQFEICWHCGKERQPFQGG